MVTSPSTSAIDATPVRRVRRLLDDAGASLVGRRVLAMCSGGADSVALVAVLGALPRGAAPRSIEVLWLDHALRAPADAERDAAHRAATCIGAVFHERRAPRDLTVDPVGIEAAARAWRYAVAADLARDVGCDVVCTGHHAGDQLELALLALAGVTGRAGDVDAMPVRRPLVDGIDLVRPLLSLSRADLERACADAGLAWVEDPTNADPEAHARNAVRHRVVPELLATHPGAGAGIVRAAERRAAARTTTEQLTSALLDAWGVDDRLDLRHVAALDGSARRTVLAAWLRRIAPGRDLGSRIVRSVDQLAVAPGRAACSRVDLPGDACVRRDGYDLVITTAPPSKGPRP